MTNIYKDAIEMVEQGSKFNVNFHTRSLKINGKFIIKDGAFNGESGLEIPDNPLSEIEKLYERYYHSIPSERSSGRRSQYFRALPEHELTEDDMLYGEHREPAQIALELYTLFSILENKLNWDDFAKDKWFWQSPIHPSLVILKNWIY